MTVSERKFRHLFWLAIGFCIVALFVASNLQETTQPKEPPKAVNGVINLAGWDLRESGMVPLTGQWRFFPKRFLNAEDVVDDPSLVTQGQIVQVPGPAGSGYQTEEGKQFGYGSYILEIAELDAHYQSLTMQPAEVFSAARFLLVDVHPSGFQVDEHSTGVPGTNVLSSIPQRALVPFQLKVQHGERLFLIIHVSNFHWSEMRIAAPPMIGVVGDMAFAWVKNLFGSVFVLGAVFIMGFYNLSLFMQRKEDRASFWLAVFCFNSAARYFVAGRFDSYFLDNSFLVEEISNKIEYLTMPIGATTFVLFLQRTFSDYFKDPFPRLSGIGTLLYCLFVLANPVDVYSQMVWLPQAWVVINGAYGTARLVQATIGKAEGTKTSLLALVLLLLGVIHDIMVNYHVIKFIEILPFVVLVFLFLQSTILGRRFSTAFRTAERLTAHLQEEVENQTAKLNSKNIELEKNNAKTKNLLRIISHDIGNPLNIIMGYVQVCRTEEEPMPKSISTSIEKIHKAASTQAEILEHVRSMEALDSGKQKLQLEAVRLRDVFDKADFIFSERLQKKGIELVIHCDRPDTTVLAEKASLSNDVFNNLISNAIKFTDSGKKIIVTVIEEDSHVVLKIQDQGIGIPGDLIEHLFSMDHQTSRRGTQGEKGTGFGMPIVKMYLDQYHASIAIESREKTHHPEDHGTTFIMKFRKPKAQSAVA